VLLGISMLAPLVLLFPDSVSGLSTYGGYGSDGWSYVAYASYLWEVPKGTEGGLSPLHQWASHLMMTRHVGGAELGLLSVLHTPGDVQMAEGLFVAVGLFGAGAACAAFAYGFGMPALTALAYVGVTMLSGWMLNAVQSDNYDFCVTLAYLPAVAAVVRDQGPFTVSRWALIACLAAALFYTYPELAPVILACEGILLIDRLWKEPRRLLIGVPIVLAGFTMLTAPYLGQSAIYFSHQAATALQRGGRPGEGFFPGLLIASQQISAFWSLGGEFDEPSLQAARVSLGAILFVLLLAGLAWLARRREWGLIGIAGLLLCGTVIFLVHHAYPYGAYKFLVIGWWLFVFCVFLGATWPFASRRTAGAWVSGVAMLLLFALPVVTLTRLAQNALMLTQRAVEQFRPVTQVPWAAGEQPVGVFVQNASAGYWAVYLLRHARIQLLDLPGYLGMAHVRWRRARAPAFPLESIRFLLTDAVRPGPLVEDEGWKLMWRAGAYCLWDTQGRGWAIAGGVATPNGFEMFQGQPFFWMGRGATSLDIVASQAGAARLVAQFGAGPNLSAGTTAIRLHVKGSAGTDRIESIPAGQSALCLPVPQGTTSWTLTPVDPFVPPPRPTPDPRELMIGVLAPRLRWSPAALAPAGGC